MYCRLTLRLQFLRHWEACKGWVAPYIGPPLVRCALAWQAVVPSRSSQQASEQPGHLAENPSPNGQSEAPGVCMTDHQEEATYGSLVHDDYAHLDGGQEVQLSEMEQYSEHDFRLLQGLENHSRCAWEADPDKGGIEHVLTEADTTAEQTDFCKHAKAE